MRSCRTSARETQELTRHQNDLWFLACRTSVFLGQTGYLAELT